MIRKCNAKTKNNTQCSRPIYLFGYCKQHLNLKKKAFWAILISIVSYLLLQLIIPHIFNKSLENFEKNNSGIIVNDFNCETEKLIQAPIFENDIFTQSLYITIANSQKGSFSLGIGKSGCISPNTEYCVLYEDDQGNCNLIMKVNEQGRILLDADLYDPSGLAIGVIRDNYLRLNEDCHFMFNYDENAIEIVDNLLNVVFSLEKVDYNRLLLRGIYKRGRSYLFMNGGDYMIKVNDANEVDRKKFIIPRLFRYTGEEWRGVRRTL